MRRSLERAQVIAQENGQHVVGTEHVLLAFLEDQSGIAGMALHSVGNARLVRAEVVHIITSEGYKPPTRPVEHSETE
jgi:ATP-dependent Clp protease ATP-binding subunit ClpA